MTVDLTLKNCKIWYKDKLINFGLALDEGKIVSISKDTGLPASDEKVDCKGNIVLPGLIDVHVHFREPGLTWKEDWLTGSKAAAKGGITYVMEMPNTDPPTTTLERILEKRNFAEKSVVNFGISAGIGKENIDQVGKLANHADFFKIYLAETTGELKLENYDVVSDAFVNISRTGKLVCVHSEDQEAISLFTEKYKDRKNPIVHALSRPPEAESLAIKKMIEIVEKTNVNLHFCHVTTRDGMVLIKDAKQGGVNVTCETCPHYLFMTQEDLIKKGTLAKMNPPLRTKRDQMALWKGIKDGTVDILASDHAPHTMEEKLQDIWTAPAGVPGVETSLQLMLNAVNKGVIGLGKIVKLMHGNPVKRFGLDSYGNIEKENDANLTIIDLKRKWKISKEDLLTKCGWSPYERWEGRGMPIMTVINGKIIHNNSI